MKINEVDERWSGSLHIGLTTLQPQELPSCPLSGLSPSLTQLRSKVTWLLAGSEVRRNGILQRQNFGCSLDRLTVRKRDTGGIQYPSGVLSRVGLQVFMVGVTAGVDRQVCYCRWGTVWV